MAEYLIATALGVNEGVRVNWDRYDIVSPEGITVEVKSSGYIQNWEQDSLSTINFGIRPTYGWDSTTTGNQKTAQLNTLIKYGAEKCEFNNIHQRIVSLLDAGL